MREVVVRHNTGFAQIEEWVSVPGDGVEFRLRRDSSFQFMREAYAVCAVTSLVANARIIVVNLMIDGASAATAHKDIPVLCGIFGQNLIRNCSRLTIGDDPTNVLDVVLNASWRPIHEDKGMHALGRAGYLFCRTPDMLMPRIVTGTTFLKPTRVEFATALRNVASRIVGGDVMYAPGQDALNVFLLEALWNCFEHAVKLADGSSVIGVWGVLVEKIVVANSKDLRDRTDIDESQRQYLSRVIGDTPRKRLAAFTVVDLGAGIHRTLGVRDGETPGGALRRAFRPGESRKPKEADVNRGLGLPRIDEAARSVNALLEVKSAELRFTADYSVGSASAPSACDIGETSLLRGTVLGLIIPPLTSTGARQRHLL